MKAFDWGELMLAILILGWASNAPTRFDCWRGVDAACKVVDSWYVSK